MSLSSLPECNLRVLEHLATYRFLTVPQLQRLGIAEHRESVYRVLRRFKTTRRKLVEKKDFGFSPGRGNLPSVFYLSRQGAAFLADVHRADPSGIKYPKGVHVFERDYFHRMATIDFHIALRQWANQKGAIIDFFDTYFDKTGSNRGRRSGDKLRARTRVDLSDRFFIPDAIYLYTTADGRKHLAVVEIHNGMDTGRFMRQMEPHIQALREGAVTDKYGLDFANRSQWIFEHQAAMHAALKRIRRRHAWHQYRPFVDFNTIENVRADFEGGWCKF